jgi:hypothetical protein
LSVVKTITLLSSAAERHFIQSKTNRTEAEKKEEMIKIGRFVVTFSMWSALLLGCGSDNGRRSPDDHSGTMRQAETIDACTAPAPADCVGFTPDCFDMCGEPFTPGGALCDSSREPPIWICCPSGFSLGWDESGAYVCTRDP